MTTERWATLAERAAWIYYQLRLRKLSATGLGAGLKPPVSRRVMSAVICGEDRTVRMSEATRRRVQRAVARAIGMKVKELWGFPSPQPSPARGEGK